MESPVLEGVGLIDLRAGSLVSKSQWVTQCHSDSVEGATGLNSSWKSSPQAWMVEFGKDN